jgi:hypothetical protein
MEEYENMVEIIKKEYSNAKLVIGEILPRYYHERLKTAELEQKRCQFNLLLKDKNLKLVQYDHVRTTDFYDGIHLNQEGINIFVKNLKEVINPLVDVRSPTEISKCRKSHSIIKISLIMVKAVSSFTRIDRSEILEIGIQVLIIDTIKQINIWEGQIIMVPLSDITIQEGITKYL